MVFEWPGNPAPLTVEDNAAEASPFSPVKFFAAAGLLQSLGIDGSELLVVVVEEEDVADDDEGLKLPLLLLALLLGLAMPLELELVPPNLFFAFDTGELLTSLLALDEGPFGQDCLTGEGLDRDDVVDEIGETLEEVEVTMASPSSSS